MKTIKYVILSIIVSSLIISSFTLLGQQKSLSFSETYTSEEVISFLNPSDDLFKMIDASELHLSSSKLGTFTKAEAKEIGDYIQSDAFKKQVPEDLRFAWGVQEGDQDRALFALKNPKAGYAGPVQDDINEVSVRKDGSENNFGLYISFSEQGAEKWATMTRDNVGRNIAILLDGKVYSAPRLMEEIKNGECMISGSFTENELNELKASLE